MLCGALVATEHLAVHLIEVNPGEHSREVERPGDIVFFVLEGTLWVRAWHDDHCYVFELHPEDACLLPDGSRYEVRNYGATTSSAIVGAGPGGG